VELASSAFGKKILETLVKARADEEDSSWCFVWRAERRA
jgi:hypothetical protein